MSVRQPPVITVALAAAATLAAATTIAVLGVVLGRIATHAFDATGDFLSFYAAGYLVRSGQGAHLYQPAVIEATERLLFPGHFDQPAGYPLPVFVAWLFAPLSKLPFTTAYFLYMAMTAAVLAGLLWVLNQQLAAVPKVERRLFMVCGALTLPSLATIVFGQVDLIALAGLLGGYLLLRAERRGLAGLALCLVLIKPQLLVGIALFLLVRREWRTIGLLAAVGLPLLIVPALLTSPGTLGGNINEVLHHDSRALAAAHLQMNANWRGFIISATGSNQLVYWAPGFLVIAAGAITIAVARWRSAAGAPAFDRDYSLAVLLPLFVSPHVHTQNLVVGLLPAALALRALLAPAASPEARRRAVNIMLLIFTLLFALPFLAIQGLSLTVFLTIGVYLALSFRWPGIGATSERGADVASDSGPSWARAA